MENKICKICKGKGKITPIPFGTGAMGYILPAAVGFALAKKVKKEEGKVYAMISDGEMQIGSTWEAAGIAAQHKLDNLILVIDWNGLQAMGNIRDILNIEPLEKKWQAFNWHTVMIDGHNYQEIERALKGEPYVPKQEQDMPRVIIARTTKGKGWKRAENNNLFHYSHVDKGMLEEAIKELEYA